MRKPALLLSAGFHAAAIGLLLLAAALAPRTLPAPHRLVIELEPRPLLPVPPRPDESGGSGNSKLLARQGPLPERARARVFIPPTIEPREEPKLAIRPALPDAPDLAAAVAVMGDPMGSRIGGAGLGDLPLGLGNGGPGGAGDGPGGFGVVAPLPPRITRQPEVIYKEEPEYSDEARKAHWEGVVVLRIDVGVDGRPSNIQVLRSVGLGLDEKAVEAIRKWRFRPALVGNQPVAAPAMIEVGFRLL